MKTILKFILLLQITILMLSANDKVSLQLLWKHQFEFAGFYVAKAKGFYEDEGLDVTIKEFDFGVNIVNDVMSNKTDIGIGRSSLVLNKLNGIDLVLLSATFQSSPYALLAKERNDLKSVSNFIGKRIMLSDNLESIAAISSMMKIQNIKETDYINVPHSFNIKDLIKDKTDLMTTYISNEPFHLKEKGIKFKIFDPKDYGFDFYANIVYTSEKYLNENESKVQKFQKASLKGWEYAFKNIDETVGLILTKYNSQNKSKDALLYEANILKELAYKNEIAFGSLDELRIKNIANVYRLLGLTNKSDDYLENLIYEPNTFMGILKQIFSFEVFLIFVGVIFTLIFLSFYKHYILKKQNKNLGKLVDEKTIELQNINDSLEEKIEARTKELQEKNDLMEYVANHDALTGLPNRLLFLDRLRQSIKHSKRKKQTTSVLFLDLDRFKEVNDTYGHLVGDELLKIVSEKLMKSVREEDTISRLGGDEFTVIIEGASDNDILAITKKIIASMKLCATIDNNEIYTTFSIGISRYPDDGDTPEELLRNADTAMYAAKENGKNQYQFYNKKMTELAIEKSKMEHDLRVALEENQLRTYYQPKVNAEDSVVIGMEALVRWNHPEYGMIQPSEFILIAEETGLIVSLDKWMMQNSLKQMKDWHRKGLNTGKLSLNLSIKQLESDGYIDEIKSMISNLDINPKYLELEITESQIMKDSQSAIKILEEIRSIGISISVDDFGTGYSSLAYLKKLPIDKLKIDRSFVDALPDDENDIAIVRAIVALAKSLNLELIAEGVENKEQLDFLIQEGCSNIQGYYYSKPLPSDIYEEFLRQYQ